jgi:RNA polymerase sigma-70 factor (ECF subfamily)
METPASLLERLRHPAPDHAWARFVDLYTPLLYYWAHRTGCQEADAADLVQEVLTLLVRKLPEFRSDQHRSFRSWLRTVALNCWRNLQRRAQLPREPATPSLADLPSLSVSDPFWEVEYRQRLVRRALALMQAEFAPTTWQACLRCVMDGQPAAEVARDLGISVGTVYASKSRVLSRLRQELADLWD